MTERLLTFGKNDRLSGIYTPPRVETELPMVITLSAGIVHRVGPNRLHVKIARQVAASGFPALRLDMSGLGESAAAPPGLGYEAQSIDDTLAAINAVQEVAGDRPTILAGLCSGADNAYRTALQAEAVDGMILLDPYAYQNRSAKINYLAKRAQDPQKLAQLVEKLGKRLTTGAQSIPVAEDEDPDNDRIAPPLEEFGADLEKLCQRGVQSCIIYTHSVHHLINAPDQFFSTFRDFNFEDKITVLTMMESDHTFTAQKNQHALLGHIEAWLSRFK